MKQRILALLCTLLMAGTLVACSQGQASLADPESVSSLAPEAGEPEAPPSSLAGNSGSASETEPAFVDDGTGAANVADTEVVGEIDFKMDFPGDWSYVPIEELELDAVYIFAATNRATGSSIIVSQPLDVGNLALDAYADATYESFGEVVELYETMGITSDLRPLAQTSLGGRDAYSIELFASSSEVDFVQTGYVVDTPAGEIVSLVVTVYDDSAEDAVTAKTALDSIRWE